MNDPRSATQELFDSRSQNMESLNQKLHDIGKNIRRDTEESSREKEAKEFSLLEEGFGPWE